MKRRGLQVAAGLLLATCLAALIAWQTVPGRVWLADTYWELLFLTGLVSAETYRGPHLWAVAPSPDGRSLAVGGMTQEALLFSLPEGAPLPSPARHSAWVMEVAWSPDGQRFASTGFDGSLTVHDRTGQRLASALIDEVAYTVSFNDDGSRLAWGGYDGQVRILHIDRREEVVFEANEDGVLFLDFAPDDEALWTAGEDGQVRAWSLEGAPLGVLAQHEAGITSFSLSPDGQQLVTGGDDGAVRRWRLAADRRSSQLIQTHEPHRGWINFVTFLPDGRYLSGGTDERLFLYRDGAAPRPLSGHSDWIMCVRPLPGGGFASSGKDGRVLLWDQEADLAGHIDVAGFLRSLPPDEGRRWGRLPAL